MKFSASIVTLLHPRYYFRDFANTNFNNNFEELSNFMKTHLSKHTNFSGIPEVWRGGGLGSRPKKMNGERLGDGVEYHLMKPTPRR